MINLFSMEGRLNRAKYFGRVLAISILTNIAAFVVGLFLGATMGRDAEQVAPTIGFMIGVTGAIVNAFQVVKRLHDINRPGAHYWLLLIPFYNIYLGLLLLFKKGTEGSNQFGVDPLIIKSRGLAASA